MPYISRIIKSMENFQEIQVSLIEQAKTHNACSDQLELVIKAKTWSELQEVICDNIDWCIKYNIELPDGHYKNSKKEFTVVDGQLHGEYIKHYKNGQVQVKCNYVDGKRQGEYVEFRDNGQVWVKCNYLNGKLHDEYLLYYSDGKIRLKCTFVHGKEHGELIEYYHNGEVCKKFNYVDGEKDVEYVRVTMKTDKLK